MSMYEQTARSWWSENRPNELALMDSPAEFFSVLARQIEARVVELSSTLAGPDMPGEDYLEKVGRLNAARSQAQEIALDELVFCLGPESDPIEEPSQAGTEILEAFRLVSQHQS